MSRGKPLSVVPFGQLRRNLQHRLVVPSGAGVHLGDGVGELGSGECQGIEIQGHFQDAGLNGNLFPSDVVSREATPIKMLFLLQDDIGDGFQPRNCLEQIAAKRGKQPSDLIASDRKSTTNLEAAT